MTFQEQKEKMIQIYLEIRSQHDVGALISDSQLSFNEQMNNIYEYINDAGEHEIAYELIICLLEMYPFVISSLNAVLLVEIALSFKYKTDRDVDKQYDLRMLS